MVHSDTFCLVNVLKTAIYIHLHFRFWIKTNECPQSKSSVQSVVLRDEIFEILVFHFSDDFSNWLRSEI